jgi:hypothetical protein
MGDFKVSARTFENSPQVQAYSANDLYLSARAQLYVATISQHADEWRTQAAKLMVDWYLATKGN